MLTIGKRLQLARDKKGVKQTKVFKDTGINNKTLSGYERDVSEPDFDTIKILAQYYDVSLDFLLGKTDKVTPYLDSNNTNQEESDKLADEFIQILIDEGLIEEGQELTPEQREKYLDIFRQSIKLAKKLK